SLAGNRVSSPVDADAVLAIASSFGIHTGIFSEGEEVVERNIDPRTSHLYPVHQSLWKCVSNLQLPDASIRTIEHHQVAVVDVRIGSIRSKPFVGASFACPAIGVEELRLVGRAAVCSVEAHQDFISSLTLHEA